MIKILFSTLLLLTSTFSAADSHTNKEIMHLLDFVEKTECIYNRNGTEHNGVEARQHIQKKYDYYRDDINSAQDFIAYSATKSLISGKKYTIICVDQKVQFSVDWLNSELKKYRLQLLEK
ncbi:DUF5329 family protein [Psychromonas hadalis]|uniref:DUF5329 family protein n=1 Tax=Psychromonas hadalis TaxID=211669 RepID=UPI0003B7588B|nr:DUF5329 family protein [Psychromonas hadalis]